jgi:hypothetical protein
MFTLPQHTPTILLLLTTDAAPEVETPAQHIRNALTMLSLIEQLSTATWVLNPELGGAMRRAESALVILEHHGPPALTVVHLRGAIQILLDAKLDWEVVTDIPSIMARLFIAFFAVGADA